MTGLRQRCDRCGKRRVVTMHPIGLDLCGPCTSEVDAVPTSTPRERAIVAAWTHFNNEVGYFRGDLADATDPEDRVYIDGSVSIAALTDAILTAAYPEPNEFEEAVDVQGNPLARHNDERCTIALGPAGDDRARCERLAWPLHRSHLIAGVYHLPANADELNDEIRESSNSGAKA